VSTAARAGDAGPRGEDADVLARLRSLVADEGGPLEGSLAPAPESPADAPFAALVASGPLTRHAPGEYGLLVESILEGYFVHYGRGRIVVTGDRDLRLLAGDFLYAAGLARLAQLGDLAAVAELGDLIGLCARVHAAGDRAGSPPWRLTAPLWGLCTLAVGLGGWPEHAEAKQAARSDGLAATARVANAASERAERVGLRLELERALIALERTVERPPSTT
jgi:hypothetical protein